MSYPETQSPLNSPRYPKRENGNALSGAENLSRPGWTPSLWPSVDFQEAESERGFLPFLLLYFFKL